jgi:hypothetical protein
MLRIKHINALNRFALRYGYGWRRRLVDALTAGKSMPSRTSQRDTELLRELYTLGGQDVIESFKPVEAGYSKVANLRKDHVEKYNQARAWFVNAWRLVDYKGADVLQPWASTKTGAREMAREANVYVIED